MPLDDLFEDEGQATSGSPAKKVLFEKYGLTENPFPSAAQTSGHPHLATSEDQKVDEYAREFVRTGKSQALAITASQGIGKTNLLNAYEDALKQKLSNRGFFVIRYVADPEPSFEHLLRSVFEALGESHLRQLIKAFNAAKDEEKKAQLSANRVKDVSTMVESLAATDKDELYGLAHQWMLGFPIRKAHRESLGVLFRLDTVEAKTRTLRDVVFMSAGLGVLQGIFLLLDELEKQDLSLSKGVVLRYLSGLRALIDALPKHLFLMAALTTDALERYKEMLPALKGRLANVVALDPIQTPERAVEYFEFYVGQARGRADKECAGEDWKGGSQAVLRQQDVEDVFSRLLKSSSIQGVRQRDFLNELHRRFSAVAAGRSP